MGVMVVGMVFLVWRNPIMHGITAKEFMLIVTCIRFTEMYVVWLVLTLVLYFCARFHSWQRKRFVNVSKKKCTLLLASNACLFKYMFV